MRAGFRAVVASPAVSIPKTGTIVLDLREDGEQWRGLSLIPDERICIVLASQIIASVPQAIARLDPRRYQTWSSGHPATSYIELNRAEAVRRPRDLQVILVKDN